MSSEIKVQSPEERELAEVRARRAALAAEREQRAASRLVADQLEAEKRGLRDEEAIEKAEAEHDPKKIAVVHSDVGVVIVKRPNHVLFKRFQDSGEVTSEECDKLVRPCLVYPDKASWDRMLEEQPALLLRCANAVATLAGVRAKELTGKS